MEFSDFKGKKHTCKLVRENTDLKALSQRLYILFSRSGENSNGDSTLRKKINRT